MNEGPFSRRWENPFAFVFLDFTSTCEEQPFSHTKSKASKYEQLILAFTSGKSLRRLRKDNNHLEKFDTYQTFANNKNNPQWKTAVNNISLCMYIFIVLIKYQGWNISRLLSGFASV